MSIQEPAGKAAHPGIHGPLGRLDTLPRARLVHAPTPLEAMPNLAKSLGRALGGAQLFVKRDDCTGLAFGGNKCASSSSTWGRPRRGMPTRS